MGKTSRWFRALLLGSKKSLTPSSDSRPPAAAKDNNTKNNNSNKHTSSSKRGLVKSSISDKTDNGCAIRVSEEASSSSSSTTYVVESVDANKHAIAVAAATAAVAEAALAAAQAAAEVVRLTSGGSRATYGFTCGSDRRRELAAVVIQSGFRAYLARRALKALKALVKLQALVRGHIVRKQSTHMLQRMQAMARIQARACAQRAYMSDSPHPSSKSSHSHQYGVASPKTSDHQLRAYGTKSNGSSLKRCSSKSSIKDNIGPDRMNVDSSWLDHWMEENSWNKHRDTSPKADDEKSDKILEVDTWKPHINLKQRDKPFQISQHVSSWNHNEKFFTPLDTLSRLSTKSQRPNPGPPPQEFINFRSLKFKQEVNQAAVWAAAAADNSPGVLKRPGSSSSSRRGPLTPARSEFTQSFLSNYMGHPSYMASTESYQSKVRSQSAPRQRMDFEKPTRFGRGYRDEETSSERGWPLHGNFNFRSRAYSGSGLSDKLGMPVQGDARGYRSTYGSR